MNIPSKGQFSKIKPDYTGTYFEIYASWVYENAQKFGGANFMDGNSLTILFCMGPLVLLWVFSAIAERRNRNTELPQPAPS